MTKKERMKEEHMRKSSVKRDRIPQHFKSVEEAAEFWDSHDLSDYWNLVREADFRSGHPAACFLDGVRA